jgi:hypothetical protein
LTGHSPNNILDLHTAYLAVSNVLEPYEYAETPHKKPPKDLKAACHAYSIEGWERFDKSTIAADIGNGNWRKWGYPTVFEYCEEDVRKTTELLRAMLRRGNRYKPIDVLRTLHWSNYSAKAIARVQARGMPIDMHLWNLVQENKAAVIAELVRRFDPSQLNHDPEIGPIYTIEGEWSYSRFEAWLVYIKAPPGFRSEAQRC